MTNYANLPAPSPEAGLSRYLQEIRKFPMLEPEEEYMLARRWADEQDPEAAHKLVTSHLRLAAKIAMGYRGYGLPQAEVISEANVGLMQAVKRFDPEKGFRLATYAMWWIKAAIQEFVLRSWSQVKLGTTASQKKLFFNLRKIKNKINAIEDGDMNIEQVEHIAKKLNVSNEEVVDMNRRMTNHDQSLNAPIGKNDGESGEWQDLLADERQDQEQQISYIQELNKKKKLMEESLNFLKDRGRDIIVKRRLSENPKTLEDLSQEYNVSRERIRQIETRAFEKLQEIVKNKAIELNIV